VDIMANEVYRVLALGESDMLDRAAASLTAEGYVVAQVDDRKRARKLLAAGGFDAVVADGESRSVSELLRAEAGGRPWILLGRTDGPVAMPEHALWLAEPVSQAELCRQVQTLVARSRKAEAPARRAKEKAAAGGARTTRPPT
jgi:DNA-binding response OmpR family regulator